MVGETRVSVALPVTVLLGLQCAANGDIVRLLTSLMVIQMLENVHLQMTVLAGLQIVQNLVIVKLVERALEESNLNSQEDKEQVGVKE